MSENAGPEVNLAELHPLMGSQPSYLDCTNLYQYAGPINPNYARVYINGILYVVVADH